MIAFQWVVSPDRRVVSRLVGLLRQSDSRTAYVTAGEALATSILAHPPGGRFPVEAGQLADAMLGSLLLLQAANGVGAEPDRRVRLALATAVLSVARPHAALACDEASASWMGAGIGSPRRMDDRWALASRVMLALFLGDAEHAAEAVDALVDADRTGVGGILYDWTVARIQGHGHDREAQCFHALRLALAESAGGGEGAALVVLGAMIVHRHAQRARGGVVGWLDRVATEVVENGTTRLSAAG